MTTPLVSPEKIMERGRQIIADIDQCFIDSDYWNRNTRKPDEALLEADPDGQMMVIRDQINHVIVTNGGTPVPPLQRISASPSTGDANNGKHSAAGIKGGGGV